MKLKNEFYVSRIQGKAVAISKNSEGETVCSLNGSGELLFNMLRDGADIDDLVNMLVEEYGIDFDIARRDASAFVEALDEQRMLEK